ncbi:MAG TPA: HAMP domain-containing sensor histidine kinase [Polyangiaceae bacterium]|nr:HAMP domain-containing sensor histidine kinase [Polyangiaceae bacterium]
MDTALQPETTAPGAPATRDAQHRARFEAVRRRVFDDMASGSARWRFKWLVPFHVFVVGWLAYGGESRTRLAIQVAALVVVTSLSAMKGVIRSDTGRALSFVVGACCYFALIATTGGLGSPLLIMVAIMMWHAATTTPDPRWVRGVMFLVFAVGFVGLALLSTTSIGMLGAPLGAGTWPAPAYVGTALAATVFTMMGIYRSGCVMTRGYEHVALELAERREQLCSAGEDRSRALEGMAARLAHEVKNPLAAIKGLSTHMARNAADPKTAERLAIVAAEADRLQSIVEGFLSFSRGLDDLTPAPIKPYDVARELAVLLETRGEEAGVTLVVNGDGNLVVDADARKLRQALLNLVLNAIQASPRGASVQVAVSRECEGARITVRDDGVGMTPEVLDRIRKPYFTTKEGGTGLGVAVARGLVEQHGGRLDIKSASGKGTTVTIVLPMKAKPCMRLPNPLRNEASPARDETAEPEPQPATAGVR